MQRTCFRRSRLVYVQKRSRSRKNRKFRCENDERTIDDPLKFVPQLSLRPGGREPIDDDRRTFMHRRRNEGPLVASFEDA